jgi:hypothetical protein
VVAQFVKPGIPGHDKARFGWMMNSAAAVSAELGLSLVVPGHGAVPLMASLCYTARDPYAVRMAFHVGAEDPVEWIFARDLLSAGLTAPAGEGDVKVWPAKEHSLGVLNIALSSPFGHAHFEAPMSAMADFLKKTSRLIAPGRESNFINIDSELDELLWRA